MTVDNVIAPSQEIAQQRDEQPAAMVPFGAATSELVLWAYEARQAKIIAVSLAKTSFVPFSLRGKPDDITAAILAGNELGMKPMATLRSIDVIKGTPALRAHAMRALVQSHGHEVELLESDDTRCVYRGRRVRGDGSFQNWQTITWTIERADKLGLIGRTAAGKTYDPKSDQWVTQPQTMLVARATGEICRLIASDVLHAMPYNAEELRDSEDAEEPVARARVSLAEIQQHRPQQPMGTPSAMPAQPVEDADVIEAVPEPAPDDRRTAELAKVQALFVDAEMADPEQQAAYVAENLDVHDVDVADLSYVQLARLAHLLASYIRQQDPETAGSES